MIVLEEEYGDTVYIVKTGTIKIMLDLYYYLCIYYKYEKKFFTYN